MRETRRALIWVVYRMAVQGKPEGVSAVCEQGEWEIMERDRPGHHTLVKGGITSEAEAEALARSTSGYAPPGPKSAKAKAPVKPVKRGASSTPLLGPGVARPKK